MFNYLSYSRMVFLLITITGAALIGMGLYLQYAQNLSPCNLCMFQRFFIIATAVVTLIGFIHTWLIKHASSVLPKMYAAIAGLIAIGGAITAGRQIWLQHLPKDQVPECGPGLDYMIETYPFMDMVLEVFKGSGDCAKVQWVFMRFSIPQWSLVCFCVAAVLCVTIILKKRQ